MSTAIDSHRMTVGTSGLAWLKSFPAGGRASDEPRQFGNHKRPEDVVP